MSDQDAPKPPQPPQAPTPPSPPAGPASSESPAAKPPAASPTVPLKKETVRITLRAKPGTGVPKPRKATAPVPPSAPASKVTARVPTAPAAPSRSTAPVPAGPTAPKVPAGTAAPKAPATPMSPGARTVPLARPASPAVRPAAKAGATGALPQATVKLQRTQPLARPGQPSGQISAPIRKAPGAQSQQVVDESDPEAGLLPLSIVAFVVSLVVMGVVLIGSNKVNDGQFLDLPNFNKPGWQVQGADGTWSDRFAEQQLTEVPSR